MPQAQFTFSLAAGATFDPLDGWDYQIPRKASKVSLIHNATAVGAFATWKALDRSLLQESQITSGGVAGVYPTIFNAPLMGPYKCNAMEKLSTRYRNPTGGAITINLVVDID